MDDILRQMREAARRENIAAGMSAHGAPQLPNTPKQGYRNQWSSYMPPEEIAALEALREKIRLAYDEGLTQAQIARRLGVSLGTVNNHVCKMREMGVIQPRRHAGPRA